MSLGGALPALLSQTADAAGSVAVQPLSLQGWSTQTTGGGTVTFIKDNSAPIGQGALQLTTDGDNASRAGLSLNTATKLASVSELSYATKQNSASFTGGDAAYRLTIDADGNTATTGDTATLVYEPYWQDPAHAGDPAPVVSGIWQTWNVANGVFWASIPNGNSITGLTNGAGGPPFYTLSQLKSLLPNALITAVSTGIGSYNTNYNVEVDALNFDGNAYNFEPVPGPVEDVTQGTYYDTIQEAVNAANPSDVIKAKAGTYNENVTVNKALTIDGANAGTPGYSGSRGSESIVTGSFNVTASNVTISGFTIDPASGSSVAMQGNYSGETIKDNIIDDNGYAVNFNTGSTSISSNQINYGAHATTGVEANSNPGSVIHFFDNHFSGNASSLPADITVIGGTKPQTADIYVDKNVSTSGTTLAALFNVWDGTVSRNTSTGAQGSAIYIGGNDGYISVVNNVVSQAVTAVNVANDFGDGPNNHVTIHQNQFDTSNVTGVKVKAGAYTANTPVDATANWWGSASGPTDKVSGDGSILDTNQNGTGSPAVGAVQYSAWCTLADCSTLSNVAPGTPTNLTAKFQYDSNNVANGSTLNITAKPGGNNLELEWTAPTGWVNGYHIITTYPNGTQNTGYQGPNTNAWLVPNGFGQHGQGKYTFQVVAVNNSGESTPSATFTLYYDTQSPVASFTKAPDNNSFINGNFEVSATVNDNVRLSGAFFDVRDPSDTTGNAWRAGCVAGTLVTNPDPIAGAGSATLSCTINTSKLVSGHTYYVRVHAGDYAGYGSKDVAPQSIRYFTFDTSAPQQPTNLQVKYQYDKAYLSNGDVVRTLTKPGKNNLELTWNDAVGDWVTGHHILVTWPDGTTHTSYQGPNTNAWLTLDGFGEHGEGKYTFQVVAVNPNGSTASTETFSLYYVSHIPTATFKVQPPKYVNGNFQITVIGKDTTVLDSVGADVRDPSSGKWVAGCINGQLLNGAVLPAYSADGSGVTVEYTCTVNTHNLVDGQTYTLRARAGFVEADGQSYGNVNSDGNWQFTYDTTAPAAPTLTSPQNDAVVNGKSITQSWSDTSGDVDHYIYQSFNDANATSLRYQTTYTGTSKTATNVSDGTVYWWRVAAVDYAGNVSSWSPLWKITVDNTAPVAQITAPSDGAQLRGTVTVSGTVTDANPDHYYFVVKDSAGKVVAGPGVVNAATVADWQWDTTKVSDGTYTIDLEARDAAGNKDANSVQTISVIVDNTAPIVNIVSYGQNGNVIQPTVSVDGTTTPTGYTYSWTTDPNVTISDVNALNPTFTASAFGHYDFTLTVTDAAGNSTSVPFGFTYSNAPTLSFQNVSTITPNQHGNLTPQQLNNNGTGTNTPQVKGDSTTVPSVKGDSIDLTNSSKSKTDAVKSSNFLGLGWWWLLILAIILGFLWFLLARRSDSDSQA